MSSAAHAAHVRFNRKICKAADVGYEQVLEVVAKHFADMSLVNASTAWHCIARFDSDISRAMAGTDARMLILQQQTSFLLAEYIQSPAQEQGETHGRCISTIAWSCAKLKFRDEGMFAKMAQLGMRWLSTFKPFELANALWGFAKLQVSHQRFFQMAHDHIMQDTQSFSPLSLSMVAWAFATGRFPNCSTLLGKMADAFAAGLVVEHTEQKPVTIANMVWALAAAGVCVRPEVLRTIARAASGKFASYNAHVLSTMLWSFARLGQWEDGLFSEAKELLCHRQRLRKDAHPQEMTKLLWAFAKYKLATQSAGRRGGAAPASSDLLRALLPTCKNFLPRLDPMELAVSTWAVTKLAGRMGKHPLADKFFVVATDCLLEDPRLLPGMSAHGVASMLSAYLEFFSECASPPARIQELVRQLVPLCSQAEMATRPSHDFDDWQCVAEAPRTEQTERAIGQPSQSSTANSHAVERSALVAPGAVAVLPSQRPTSSASGSGQPVGNIGRGTGLAPLASDVPLTRLVAPGPPRASPQQRTPTISIIPELTTSDGETDDKYVTIAFSVAATGVVGVLAESYSNGGKQSSAMFPISDDANRSGMYFRIPRHAGKWFVCLTMLDVNGNAVGKPTAQSFKYNIPTGRNNIESQHFNSAASTYAATGAGPYEASPSSSDAGDPDENIMDSRMGNVPDWHLSLSV